MALRCGRHASVTRIVEKHLSPTHPGVTCRFGQREQQGRWEMVLTANGVVENFALVTSLATSAPPLRNFLIVAFHPPGGSETTLRFADVELHPKDIRFQQQTDGDHTSLTLFVEGCKGELAEESEFQQALCNLLTAVLGEYEFETRIGYVDVAPMSDDKRKLPTVAELPAVLSGLTTSAGVTTGAGVTTSES